MNKIIKDKLGEIKLLCKRYQVKTMYAFGSSTSDNFKHKSDIDLLITFEPLPIETYSDYYFDLHHKLSDLLNRQVDLVTQNSLSNPYFIQEVERTKKLIYAN